MHYATVARACHAPKINYYDTTTCQSDESNSSSSFFPPGLTFKAYIINFFEAFIYAVNRAMHYYVVRTIFSRWRRRLLHALCRCATGVPINSHQGWHLIRSWSMTSSCFVRFSMNSCSNLAVQCRVHLMDKKVIGHLGIGCVIKNY